MTETIFIIGSVTLATKAKQALLSEGIYCRVFKPDVYRRNRGCIYAIAFHPQYQRAVSNTLYRIGIKYEMPEV